MSSAAAAVAAADGGGGGGGHQHQHHHHHHHHHKHHHKHHHHHHHGVVVPPPCERDVFWYEPGHLSEEHEQRLKELRLLLEQHDYLVPGLDDRPSLLRFLRSRQFCVQRAFRMMAAMAAWRAQNDVDALLTPASPFCYAGELPLVKRLYPHFYHKLDRFGRPVYYELLGEADIDALMRVTTLQRFLTYHIEQAESLRRVKLPACSAAAGRTILTQTVVLDLQGLSASRHFTRTVKHFLEQISEVDQSNYPEHLGCMFIVNAPLIFRGFWAAISGFLHERTLAKIKVLGGPAAYRGELLAVIPAESLPQRFGGSSACDERTDVGPWVGCEPPPLPQQQHQQKQPATVQQQQQDPALAKALARGDSLDALLARGGGSLIAAAAGAGPAAAAATAST